MKPTKHAHSHIYCDIHTHTKLKTDKHISTLSCTHTHLSTAVKSAHTQPQRHMHSDSVVDTIAAKNTGSHAPDYRGSENKSNRNRHTVRGRGGKDGGFERGKGEGGREVRAEVMAGR